ncbi:MAG: tRNA lysidine(34) synthetase TilS [Lachnospiraceae bacterium]
MLSKVRLYCMQKELLQQGDRVLLGISGGADSVCLLFVLLSLAKEWNLSLVPVHVHHHLRGEEADRDLKFCEELCRRYGLSLMEVHADVKVLAREHGWSVEEAGRNARYEAFYRIAGELNCQKIAVAHHRDDQVETVLFQMFRGSRLRGLSGMEAKNGMLIRPLLSVSREEIQAYLKSMGENWCTDSTNLTEDYTRNRIRQRLLPLAEEISPGAGRHIAETAEYLQRVERFITMRADELYEQAVTRREVCAKKEGETRKTEFAVSVPHIRQADTLLSEQVLYRVLCEVAGQKKDITAEHVADCLSLLERQTGRSLRLPHGVTALRSYDRLLIFKEGETEDSYFYVPVTEFPCELELPFDRGKITFSLEETGEHTKKYIEKCGGIPKCTYTKWFDYDKINDIIALRMPMPSDTLALYADGRGKSLHSVFKDAKVPGTERNRTVLLAEGSRVLWIPGIRGSEAYHITEHTRRILIVTIHGGKEDGRSY